MERGLYIVPTPIGNLKDVSQRVIEVLGGVTLVAAEDTRHCRQLLQHLGVEARVTAFHEHSNEQALQALCERVEQGDSVALVSDAGTPLISDPGYTLVRAMQARSRPVVPLPGPGAAIVALSASGLATDRFSFEGFLPAKTHARREYLSQRQAIEHTMVFYEAPHRIAATLVDMESIFGPQREAAIGRELTKTFETIRRAPLADLSSWVAGAAQAPTYTVDAMKSLERIAEELPPRKAAALIADLTGLKARDLYQYLLDRK